MKVKKIIIISIGLIIKSCIIYAQPNAKTDTLKIEVLLKRIEILAKFVLLEILRYIQIRVLKD